MFVKCLCLSRSSVHCKSKEFSDMKTICLSGVGILWRVSTKARKVCYACKDQESKVGAKFRTIYLKL